MNLPLEECIENSSKWLEEIQNKADGGWGQYQGADSNCLNTAEAIIALLETGSKDAGDHVIQRGIEYLIEQQLGDKNCADWDHYGSWSRNVSTKNSTILHIPDVTRTSLAILALKLAGVSPSEDSIIHGIEWLISVQNQDGGWGYRSDQNSRFFPTCITLKTLLRICSATDSNNHKLCENKNLKDVVLVGLNYIRFYRNNDGSFGKDHELVASHTLHTIDTLCIAKKQEYIPKIYIDWINPAVDWVQDNRKEVLKWATETIMVGQDYASPYNYTFSHI